MRFSFFFFFLYLKESLKLQVLEPISFGRPTILQKVIIGTLFDVRWLLAAQVNLENELFL